MCVPPRETMGGVTMPIPKSEIPESAFYFSGSVGVQFPTSEASLASRSKKWCISFPGCNHHQGVRGRGKNLGGPRGGRPQGWGG